MEAHHCQAAWLRSHCDQNPSMGNEATKDSISDTVRVVCEGNVWICESGECHETHV